MTSVAFSAPPSAEARVLAAYRQIDAANRPELWIHLRDRDQVLAEARALDHIARQGLGLLPLAGLLVGVKDNIDVAGLPTTAACPEFKYVAAQSAPAVQRLVEAGAIVIGKTNLDQFATGLVGARSPYGAVGHATNPSKVSGGSSSGSAVAVALGIVDIALGTDTAGSGRVPAAFHGLVGIKATLGLVPTRGVVPASRSYDAVTVFARTLQEAVRAMRIMTGPDAADPLSRSWPHDVRLAAPPSPKVAIPDPAALEPMTDEGRAAFAAAVERLTGLGAQVRVIDVAPLLEAAKLLYDGALVAERYAAVGRFLDSEPAGADPTVSAIIRAARTIPAYEFIADVEKLDYTKLAASKLLEGFDALLMPTVPEHPTLEAVAADPIGVNRRLGVYTNFLNLLDLAAVAIPAGLADGSPFGVTIVSRAFEDQVGLDLAARFLSESEQEFAVGGIDIAVFGAHLSGQPLNHQLLEAGARFRRGIHTAPEYSLYALDTNPPKPGLVGVPGEGVAIAGELWSMSRAALGSFLADLPWPMTLGQVRLDDGSAVVGFGCAAESLASATDISRFGGWREYLAAVDRAESPD